MKKCKECEYIIEYQNLNKFPNGCSMCGRSQQGLFEMEDEYFRRKNEISRN